MKTNISNILAKISAGCCWALVLSACSSDIETPYLQGFDNAEARQLTASVNDITLDGNNEDATAVIFNWTGYDLTVSNPDYKVPEESITPFIEFSKTADFHTVDTTLQVKGHEKSFTNSEMNLILSNTGYEKRVKTPLCARIRYAIGENKAPQYSHVLQMTATAYGIMMNRMDVLATDKNRIVGTLYSPMENGIYQGYVAATGDWMNFYLRERNNTIWGCVPEQAYNMSNDEDNMWNFWLQNVADCYRVTANTNTRTWGSERILKMTLEGTSGKSRDMKFDRKENAYTAIVTTTGNETFSANATTFRYDIDHKDGVNGDNISLPNILQIAEAGTWLVTINMSGEQPTASYGESEEEELVTYAPVLLMIDNNDWNNVKCRMYSPAGDGRYMGFYRTTQGWENFLLATEGRETIWGSLPGSQFTLDSAEGHYNLWGDEKVGLYIYSANLPESNWSQRFIEKLSVAGTIQGGNQQLAYNADNKTWYADITVTEADGWGVKILLDDNWSDVLVSKGDGQLGYNDGGDIKLPGTGKYRLTINLFDMQHLTYEFTKID